MKMSSVIAAVAALLLAAQPVTPSTLAPSGERTLSAQLCGGGEVTIPLGPDKDREPHCPKGNACHAANSRKQFDPGQRPADK